MMETIVIRMTKMILTLLMTRKMMLEKRTTAYSNAALTTMTLMMIMMTMKTKMAMKKWRKD